MTGVPTILARGMQPVKRESSELVRLSPMTKNQATTSRRTRWPMVTESLCGSCCCLRAWFLFGSAFTFHRYWTLGHWVSHAIGAGWRGYSAIGAATFGDFQLNQVSRIGPSITR